MATVTKTITVIPSGYISLTNMTINASYAITRGYTNADDTTYTRFDGTASTTGYVYFTFDTSSIPANATITSVTARGKARVSNTTRVSSTVMQLYTNTTAKGDNTTFAATTASTQDLSAGSWTRTELNNLRLRIGGTFSSSSSSKRIDFYGADVTITYTVPTYTVSASGDGTLDPSSSTTVEGGESYTLRISGLSAKPTVTDNNVDVTSSLTETTEVTETLIPGSNTVSGWYSSTDLTNMYTDASSDTRATFQLAGGSTGTVYLDIGDISIPSGATIKSVTCQATLQYGRNNSSSGFTSSCQMYAGSTAKGSSTSWVTAGGTDVAKTTISLTIGSWTASEINNARFYLTATNNASSTRRYVYIYGVSFSVTYESDGITYVYTLSNVSADHTIVVTAASAAQDKMFIKTASTETELYSQTSSNYDLVNLKATFNSGIIVPGDEIRVVCTDMLGWNSGASHTYGSYEVEFVRTASYGNNNNQYAFENGASSGKGVMINQYGANYTLSLQPYHSSYSNDDGFGGRQGVTSKMEIYKKGAGGWVEAAKVYKKVNGSWVEQSDLTTVFTAGTNYVKGN